MRKVGDLSQLHTKYFDAGLRVVAISDEPSETLRKKMTEALGAKYWIGSDPERKTLDRYTSDSGGAGIPHFYLIGADGKVIGSQLPSEAQLRALLEQPHKLDKPLHAKLARARAAYDAGVYGAAHKTALAMQKDPDATVAADATLLCAKVAGHAAFLRSMLAADTAEDVNERYGRLLALAMQFAGLEPAKWAQAQLAALKKHDRVKSFQPEWDKLENAMRTEMLAEGKAERVPQIKQMYDEVAKKYARSIVGRLATERGSSLGGARK